MYAHQIVFDPFVFVQLLQCDIRKTVNQHARATISGIISEELEDQYIEMSMVETRVKIIALSVSSERRVIFDGILSDLKIANNNSVKTLTAELVSASKLLDLTEYTRSFQNPTFTTEYMLDFIGQNYDGYRYISNIDTDTPSEEMIVQYKETDWEFAKRMASKHNSFIIPECTQSGIRYYIGLPKRDEAIVMRPIAYEVKKNLMEYKDKEAHCLPDIMEADIVYYVAKDREIYDIGQIVQFSEKTLYICDVRSVYADHELIHYYTLKPERGFRVYRYHNRKIIGASLDGSVTAVAGDMVQVHLVVDGNSDKCGRRWHPYSTVYSTQDGSGWYAMPEVGDKIRLYFPSEHETTGYVISSTHLPASDGVSRSDPSRKSIKNIHGKEILLTPKEIVITNNQADQGNNMTIILNDDTGITILCDRGVNFVSNQDLCITSTEGSIALTAKGQIVMADENGSSITMNQDGITAVGTEINLS